MKIVVKLQQKLLSFNSVNSEIIGRKFTKFAHDVAGLLQLNLLAVASRSANPLSNAEAKSKGRSWRCLQTSSKFNWLPQQCPFGDRQTNIGIHTFSKKYLLSLAIINKHGKHFATVIAKHLYISNTAQHTKKYD